MYAALWYLFGSLLILKALCGVRPDIRCRKQRKNTNINIMQETLLVCWRLNHGPTHTSALRSQVDDRGAALKISVHFSYVTMSISVPGHGLAPDLWRILSTPHSKLNVFEWGNPECGVWILSVEFWVSIINLGPGPKLVAIYQYSTL